MAKLEIFYLRGCPYCRNAENAIEELTRENPAYAAVEIDWIEENDRPDLADARDYFRVPTVYLGEEKLYEARPIHSYAVIRENLRAALDRALDG